MNTTSPISMLLLLQEARDIAVSIREDWNRYQNVSARERKAATLLLTLADEIEELNYEVKLAGWSDSS